MTTLWSIEFKRQGKWEFSASYPTKRQAMAWVRYMDPALTKRVTKWVKAEFNR